MSAPPAPPLRTRALTTALPHAITVEAWQEELQCSGGGHDGSMRAMLGDLVMNWLIMSGYQSAAEAFQEEASVHGQVHQLHSLPCRAQRPHFSPWSEEIELEVRGTWVVPLRAGPLTSRPFVLWIGLPPASVPLSSISARTSIRESLSRGDVSTALSEVEALVPGSLTGPLLLALRQQQLVELLREDRVPEALDFARTHLRQAACNDPAELARMESIMSLLAFGELPLADNPAGHLLAQSRRTALGDRVNEHVLEAQLSGTETQLARTIKALAHSQEALARFIPDFPRLDFVCDCAAAVTPASAFVPTASPAPANGAKHASIHPSLLDPASAFEELAQAEAIAAREAAVAAAREQALRLEQAEQERLARARREEARRGRAAQEARFEPLPEPPLSDDDEEEEAQQGEEEEEEEEDQEMST